MRVGSDHAKSAETIHIFLEVYMTEEIYFCGVPELFTREAGNLQIRSVHMLAYQLYDLGWYGQAFSQRSRGGHDGGEVE